MKTKTFLRLMMAVLLLAFHTQVKADTYVVAGDNTTVFGGSSTWNGNTSASAKMTLNSYDVYEWTSAKVSSDTKVEFKVVKDGKDWYGDASGNNLWVNIPAGYSLTVYYKPNSNPWAISMCTIAGQPQAVFGGSGTWQASNTDAEMTLNEEGIYEWTSAEMTSEQTGRFKVTLNRSWDVAYPSSDVSFTIPEGGKLTVYYTPSTSSVTTKITPNLYLVGDFNSWAANDASYKFTYNSAANNYTLSDVTFTEATTIKYVDSNGNWYGTTEGIKILTPGDTFSNMSTEGSGNNFSICQGTYTFTVSIDNKSCSLAGTISDDGTHAVYLTSEASSWGKSDDYKFNYNSSTQTYQLNNVTLTPLQEWGKGIPRFKIIDDEGWLGYNGTLTDGSSVTLNRDADNAQIAEGEYNFTYKPATRQLTVTAVVEDEPEIIRTGKMYAIGEVAGNTWLANQGIEMTSYNDGTVFKLSNVQILAGKCFAFATALGSTEDDWSGLNTYRINSSADGDFWGVTSTMTDRDNPTPLNIVPWSVASTDKPFQMAETANYDITVDLNTNTVTISRRYGALYMFYGDHWKPNAGAGMITYDGNIYTLSDVQLNGGDTFQFATHLSSSENWGEIASYRYGSNAEGTQWIINKADLNKDLSDAIAEGSQKDFKLADDAGGTFRVVVNLTDKVVTLFKMAEVFDGKVIVHLEQTSNVSNPKLWAYDKERLNDEAGTAVHVDRPDRTEISNNRKIIYEGVPNANDTTTVDGRTWWTWELEHPMIDFWFTRNGYEYNRSDLTNDNMTDIVWRSSGELYLTWPDDSNTPEDYTRDYYAAAAHEAASSAVMIEGHLYVYFTNTPGWEYVFCHAWYTDEAGVNHDLLTSPGKDAPAYPGALCELVGYDSDGYSVWRMDLTAAGVTITPNGILFNNGIDNHHNYATGENNAGVTEQSSDNEFHNGTCYDYCGVVTTGNSLASLISNGVVNGPVYTVQDDLIGVYLDRNATTTVTVDGVTHTLYGALYCKDKNNFLSTPNVEKSLQKEGEIDYMKENFVSNNLTIPSRYDQSNWVKLVISTQYPGYTKDDRTGQLETLEQYVGYVLPGGTVRAQLTNTVNPEMHLALDALPDPYSLVENTYYENPNVFITSSFVGSQTGTDKLGRNYDFFFVTPKPQEYAQITWAVYGGDDKFYVCTSGWYDFDNTGTRYAINGYDLNGYFPVKWDAQSKPVNMEDQKGQLFSFKGIIHYDETATGGGSSVRRKYGEVSGEPPYLYKTNVTSVPYSISPVDINLTGGSIITSVEAVETVPAEVESVTYVDLTGRQSLRPFEGVNMVVTRYTDGTTKTQKVIR